MVLLMTASVEPKGMLGASFVGKDREKMYRESLCFYLEKLEENTGSQKIIFCENSGVRFVSFQAIVPAALSECVEFLFLDSTHFDNSKGKGYNDVSSVGSSWVSVKKLNY